MNTRLKVFMRVLKRTTALGVLILVTSAVSIALFDYFGNRPPHSEGIEKTTLHSTILGQERELIIHLPSDYDTTRSYPVVYVMDGSSQDNHIAVKFEVLSAAGYAPKVIVIGIPNMTAENRQRDLTPPFLRTEVDKADSPPGKSDKFLSFMESELFPFIEKHYAASRTRLFMGNSRAGLLVMYSMLYKPEMFQARFCYSTPFWRQEYVMVSKMAEFLRSSDTLRTFVFMSAGEKETENIRSGLDRMARLFKEQAPFGFVWHSDYTANADHQNNSEISAAMAIAKWSEYFKR